MSEAELFDLAADNRRHAARVFARLTPEQWAAPSLCTEWTVRDVAGHFLLPLCVSTPRMVLGMLRHRGSFDAYNAEASRRLGRKPVDEIVSLLEQHAASRFTPPGHDANAPLADTSIHLRDVARPLGLDDSPPLSTWRIVLDFLVTPKARGDFVAKGLLDGLQLRATDQEWGSGSGAAVEGPSEALALVLTGRPAGLADLGGPGAATLAGKLR
ncbi:MAG TPA: maleylpyruvate isomerase family mycothiol-dependent enzyme [Intrasporangium sp.]|uniref:maleylpyruvate isomerase family mycothiol-dependent enzyme n=1 Tax=Intrasporangium sp. TaxID=1925024 RepID=UPI002D782505|nr:maleylpyruvate isomerase family mycothiol-dependent enzyme [Intrasporangium sp.]HET7399683.1 maleylpyruvate isomerase family mycothiol-dependent enzyme [Intrasporangium sp.]